MEVKKADSKWFLITIDDPNLLDGESILTLLNLLLKAIPFKWVILDYLDGSGNKDGAMQVLKEKQGTPIKVKELLNDLKDIQQLDWGDFFLFKNDPQRWDDPTGTLYPHVVAQTDTAVRLVDNQYFYIYTPLKELVDLIQKNYEIESLKIGVLEELDYPD